MPTHFERHSMPVILEACSSTSFQSSPMASTPIIRVVPLVVPNQLTPNPYVPSAIPYISTPLLNKTMSEKGKIITHTPPLIIHPNHRPRRLRMISLRLLILVPRILLTRGARPFVLIILYSLPRAGFGCSRLDI